MDIIRLYSIFKDSQQKDVVRLTKQAFWDGKNEGYDGMCISKLSKLSIYLSIYLSIWAGCVLQQLKMRYMINFNKQSINPMDEDKDWLNWLIIGS